MLPLHPQEKQGRVFVRMRNISGIFYSGGAAMFRKRRNGFLIPVLLLMIPLLSSCGSIRSADTDDYPQTTGFRIRTSQVIAEQTSTPEPVVIIREPVKNHSPLRIQLDAPDSADMPEYYQPVDFGGIPYCVYAYTDINNTTVFRVYAEVDELEDRQAEDARLAVRELRQARLKGYQGKAEEAKEKIEADFQKLKDSAAEAKEAIKDSAAETKEAIKESAAETKEAIKETVAETKELIKENAEENK